MSNKNKSLVLGSNTFNFIASMACRSLGDENKKEFDFGSDCSTAESDKEKKILISNSEEETFNSDNLTVSSMKYEINQTSLVTDFNAELNLQSKNTLSENENEMNEPSFTFKLLSKAEKDYEKSFQGKENFLKGCKWSPDGTCILTNSDDSILRIFDTNNDMLNTNGEECKEIVPSLKMVEPEIIYDYAWYPFMDSSNPVTACVFSTSKDNPIHLFDAYSGQIRCSYKGYNHLDELVNAYSIAFDSEGSKMYCGYNKCIKVFDISRPGKNYQDVKLNDDQYKLPGIVSCIAFSKTQNGVYAVGSYSKYIGIYVESNHEPICLIQSHKGGLTHLVFSADGNKLFSGARKDSDIFCWDIRNPGKILQTFKRDIQTNQRVYFDLYENYKYLTSGNNDGSIKLWNAENFDVNKDSEPILTTFKAHETCVNGVSFHPTMSLLASSSGQRHYFDTSKKFKYNCSSSSSDSDNEDAQSQIVDNSLKIWKFCL